MAKKFSNKEDAINYLNTLPLNVLIDVAAEAIMSQQNSVVDKIVVTPEQLSAFFRVRGFKDNGEVETRGRKGK